MGLRGTVDDDGRPGWVDRAAGAAARALAGHFWVFELKETLERGKGAKAVGLFYDPPNDKYKAEADHPTRKVWDPGLGLSAAEKTRGVAFRLMNRWFVLFLVPGLVRFKLKQKLTIGGEADAVRLVWDGSNLVEKGPTFKVKDAINTFKGESGQVGYMASFSDADREEVIQLSCN